MLSLLERKLLTIPFRLEDELIAVKKLLNKYNNIPMSLADGCLVRLAEQITDSVVLLWTAISKYIERKVERSYPQLCRMTYSSINHSGLNCGDICSILNGYLSSSFALLNLRERIKDILKSRILEKNENVNKILKNNQLGTRDVAATERMLENLLNQVNSIEVLYVYQAFDYS